MPGTDTAERQTGNRLGAALVWFGTLGGAFGWAAHLTIAWLTEESVCAGGTTHRASLGTALILMTAVPGVIVIASLAVSALAWRKTRAVRAAGDQRYHRTAFVAVVGVVANSLFLLIVIYDSIALVVFPPCR